MTLTRYIYNDSDRMMVSEWAKTAEKGCCFKFYPPKRTTPQNAKMWAMLTEVSEQLDHNGRKFSPEDWKCLFMHALGYEAHFMTGLSGEPFPVGFRTSKMSKEQMAEFITFIEAEATARGVVFRGME